MPRDKHKGERRPTKPPKKASAPEIRDPRPASFAADTTAAIHELGFPCTVAVGGGGLAVYASRRIHAGEQILVERPLVLTVSHQCRKHICAHCIADSRKSRPGGLDGAAAWTVRCDRCGTQHYCSEACAAAAAPRHSGHECQAMASAEDLRADLEDDDLDTISQAIRMLCDKAHGFAISCGPPGVLASATSHAERLVGISPSTDEARTCLSRICAATLRCLPSEVRVPSAELLDLLERHACNLYGVTGPAGEDTAGASFAGFFHLFNHSCSPNVVFDSARRVDGATAEGAAPLFALRALFDTSPGEELCISYTSSADGIARPGGIGRAAGGRRGVTRGAHPVNSMRDPTDSPTDSHADSLPPPPPPPCSGPTERSDHLEEYYGFRCTCTRCQAHGDVGRELDFADRLEGRRCSRCECGSGLSVPVLPAGLSVPISPVARPVSTPTAVRLAPVRPDRSVRPNPSCGEADGPRPDHATEDAEVEVVEEVAVEEDVAVEEEEGERALRCMHCGEMWMEEVDEWGGWR